MATSQETFGNRLNAPHVYQSLNLSGPRASATSSAAMQAHDKSAGDDEFDVDREQPREEKKFDAINESQTLTTINEQQSDFNDTLGALNRDNVTSF